MKRSEMNLHQREAFDYICEVMSEYIGGYENTLSDYPEGTEEYQEAKEFLGQGHEELKGLIYDEVMRSATRTAKHLRFAGTDFIMERIDRRLTKWGY